MAELPEGETPLSVRSDAVGEPDASEQQLRLPAVLDVATVCRLLGSDWQATAPRRREQARWQRMARPAILPFQGTALVSVVIPTRNRRALLGRALCSVLEQSYPRWEIIIVDDGSADGTVEALRAFGDSRIRLEVGRISRGAGHARSFGAGVAKGDFIAFLDSDDYWLPDKLWMQLAAAEAGGRHRTVVLCPPATDNGTRIIPVRQPPLRKGQTIADYVYTGAQATVLSSCLLVEGELGRSIRFDPALSVNQDTDYLLRLEAEGARFCCVHEALYVQDTRRRRDRVSYNPALRQASRLWFHAVSKRWSPQARRGYMFWDLAVRYAATGRRDVGLLYFLLGFSLGAGPHRVLRQLLLILGGGAVPAIFSRLVSSCRQPSPPEVKSGLSAPPLQASASPLAAESADRIV